VPGGCGPRAPGSACSRSRSWSWRSPRAYGCTRSPRATSGPSRAASLRDERPSASAIWLHVVCSAVALALVTYKVAESGRARLSRGLDPARFLTDGLSLLLAALAVPLLATGVALLFFPGSSSATAYAHLVGSAWWMTLFGVHLVRYLGRALDATFRDRGAPHCPTLRARSPPTGPTLREFYRGARAPFESR